MKKIAVLGPEGTYSDIAAKKYFEKELNNNELEIVYYPSIVKGIKAIDDNTISIVPFENGLDGFITESLDQIILSKLQIRGQMALPVDFAFIGNSKNIEDIKEVFVQFKAYGQCLEFISRNSFNCIKTESNIVSLNKCLESGKEYGAIIPMHKVFDVDLPLEILHVADSKSNQTRFFVLDNNKTVNDIDGDFESSIVFSAIQDKPGILYQILREFYDRKINLKSILSRPSKTGLSKYNFYIEVSGKKEEKEIFLKLIDDLKSKSEYKVDILGIYNPVGE